MGKQKQIKKIIPYLLILTVLVGIGLFGSAGKAQAAGVCWTFPDGIPALPAQNQNQCETNWDGGYRWSPTGSISDIEKTKPTTIAPVTSTGACFDKQGIKVGFDEANCKAPDYVWSPNGTWQGVQQPVPGAQSAFKDAVDNQTCGIDMSIGGGGISVFGCVVKIEYYAGYLPATFFLYVSAIFFNAILDITMNGGLLSSPFLADAWAVTRDLSNIFFILILLYIAIKLILGLGGSDVKKMIAKVIIVALLINFSMFFTQVVIDSSNILALVFYNKLQPTTTKGTDPLTDNGKPGAKDVSGTMYGFFDPTKVMDAKFFLAAASMPIPTPDANGNITSQNQAATTGATKAGVVPPGIMLGIILFAVIFMYLAVYCFFMAGLSFVGRLIELFILLVFSPFAFMSSTVPILSQSEYIGWDAWLKQLLKTSFMAPIFMFFLYFIFLLLKKNPFTNSLIDGQSVIQKILNVAIPGLVILILLLQATKFAKKGAGKIGEVITKVGGQIGGMATGLALGAATGGAATLGRATVGRAGSALANSEWAKTHGTIGRGFQSVGRAAGSASFDVRGAKIGGKTLAGATGMNLGEAQKGGFTQARKEQVEKRQKINEGLKVGEDEKLKQDLNKTEMDLQELLSKNTQDIEGLDKLIEKKRQEASDAKQQMDAGTITQPQYQAKVQELTDAKENKTKLRTGLAYTNHNGDARGAIVGAGGSIDTLEKQQKTDVQAIKTENAKRGQNYAKAQQGEVFQAIDFVFSGGQHSFAGAREAAHNIIMETKLDSGTKT